MRKILTIDCWNTLIKPSGDKERIIYLISRRLNIPFRELWETTESIKERLKDIHHLVSNYMFWHHVKTEMGLQFSVPYLLEVANEFYDTYEPQMINPDGWRDVISTAFRNNWEVKILSNTGYLKSEWLEEWIHRNFRFYNTVPFIGSDCIGAAKPSEEFYLTALDGVFNPTKDKWVHIGDDDNLDIQPVQNLSGITVKMGGWETLDIPFIEEVLTCD